MASTESKTKEWKDLSKEEKRNGVIGLFVVILILIIAFSAIGNGGDTTANNSTVNGSESKQNLAKEETKTPKQEMFEKLNNLIESNEAFDTGSYIKGDIPEGDYAFVSFDGSGKYYSEEDSAGNIIDNDNFDSFGYVHVHDAGNVETQGVLIKVSALKKLGAEGAKDVYEILNDQQDYNGSAFYKVGTDIKPGAYTVKSYGEGYVAILTGPVGNNEIISNNNFNGKYLVHLQKGQYLQVSRGEVSK